MQTFSIITLFSPFCLEDFSIIEIYCYEPFLKPAFCVMKPGYNLSLRICLRSKDKEINEKAEKFLRKSFPLNPIEKPQSIKIIYTVLRAVRWNGSSKSQIFKYKLKHHNIIDHETSTETKVCCWDLGVAQKLRGKFNLRG